jgi:hypothetical protein
MPVEAIRLSICVSTIVGIPGQLALVERLPQGRGLFDHFFEALQGLTDQLVQDHHHKIGSQMVGPEELVMRLSDGSRYIHHIRICKSLRRNARHVWETSLDQICQLLLDVFRKI